MPYKNLSIAIFVVLHNTQNPILLLKGACFLIHLVLKINVVNRMRTGDLRRNGVITRHLQ